MKQVNKLFRFDLIRELAMLLVIFTHFNDILVINEVDTPFVFRHAGANLSLSQIGVVLFVLMSGTLSAMSLERCLPENGRMERKAVLGYYKKRLLSIMPMYYVAYAMAFVFRAAPARVMPSKAMIWTLLGLDGYVSMSGVTTCYLVGEWFVGMIIICYLLCPLLYQAIKRYPRVTFCILLVYYFFMVIWYPFDRKNETDVLLRVMDFSIGMYLGIYVKRMPGIAAAVCLAVTAVFIFVPMNFDVMFSIVIGGTSIYCVLWYLGDQLQKLAARPVQVFRSAASVWAKYSFAVYMIHMLVINAALPPYAGEHVSFARYLVLLVYCGLMMAALGVILFGAEKHVMGIVNGFLAKRREKKNIA